jgi:streptogramin lyase
MIPRREFLLMAAVAAGKETARRVKVVTAFRSPGPQPNGLQATAEGLWVLDQRENRVYLVDYENGKVLRGLDTDSKAGSGITFDGEALWLASTYSREIIRADARTGKTLAKYSSPGSGVVAWGAGRRSPLAPKPSAPAAASAAPAARQATGAHGLEWKNGRLWIAVPPAQKIYRVNPKTFEIEHQFATAGDRPHGVGWEGDYLWCVDSNLNAMVRHDTRTGAQLERIQLADSDPLPHGMSIWNGTVWYCDDVGVVCRFSLR